MADDFVNIRDCKQYIHDNYVGKLLKFLREKSGRVATNQEFMKVYQVIIH